METQPMKASELGEYVCVAPGGCRLSPAITIAWDGVWFRPEGAATMASAHLGCLAASRPGDLPRPADPFAALDAAHAALEDGGPAPSSAGLRGLGGYDVHWFEPSEFDASGQTCAECGCAPGATHHRR